MLQEIELAFLPHTISIFDALVVYFLPLTAMVIDTSPDITIRVGCRLVYQAIDSTPILLMVRPRTADRQYIVADNLAIDPYTPFNELSDWQGNLVQRWDLPPGATTIIDDAIISVPSSADNFQRGTFTLPIRQLPPEVLRYLMPSRYCDADKAQEFASCQFGGLVNGVDRVVAICNWVNFNIRYITGSGRSDLSASEVLARGYGVCRDFAHVAIALCRAVNVPARYVTGHLPDVGCYDPGSPMDFHAYFEVFLDGEWCPFDARFNTPRVGRVKIAHGLDAADCAFSTTFGDARLASIKVWAYQVNPSVVTIGDVVDLSKRLDGNPHIRFA